MENPQKCKNMKNGKVEKWINWQIPKFQNPPTIYFIGKNLWLRKNEKPEKWEIPKNEKKEKRKK